jgi:phospholipase/carboxylesterase
LLEQYLLSTGEDPKLCFIWMHGLGADAQDMLSLAKELRLSVSAKHIALQAPIRPVTCNQGMPMSAWYDITELSERNEEDEQGVLASVNEIHRVIHQEMEAGFSSKQIVLAGFSQGGAMAFAAGLSAQEPLAAIISLSAYLPISEQMTPCQRKDIPIFVALGLHDEVVLPVWTARAVDWLKQQGFQDVSDYRYPMQHTVCFEEIMTLSYWISTHVPIQSDGKERS